MHVFRLCIALSVPSVSFASYWLGTVRAGCWLVCLCLVLSWIGSAATVYAAPVSSSGPASPATTARILVEAIHNRPEGVELQLSGPARHKWKTLPGNPAQGILDRCYVDVSPASIGRHAARFLDNANGPIQHIRLAQFRPDTVRLVLDFRSPQSCHVLTQPGAPHRLLVTVGQAPVPEEYRPRSRPPKRPAPTPVQKPAVTAPIRPSAPQASPAVPVPALLSVQPSAPLQDEQDEQDEQNEQGEQGEQNETQETVERGADTASPQDKVDTTDTTNAINTIDTINPALPAALDLPDLTNVVWQPAYRVWTFGLNDQPAQAPDQPTPSPAEEEHASESQHTQKTFGPSVQSGLPEQSKLIAVQPTALQLTSRQLTSRQLTGRRETAVEEAMHMAWIIALSVGCILAFVAGGGLVWWITARRSGHRQDDLTQQVTQHVGRLEDLVGQAGLLNNDLLEALEHKQKQLELLLTRADWVSQDLRRVLTQVAAGERREGRHTDPYATAALLLTEGETIEDIARTLKLPLAQVRLVHALKQEVRPEKDAASPEKIAVPVFTQPAIPSLPSELSELDEPDVTNLRPDRGTHLAASGQ